MIVRVRHGGRTQGNIVTHRNLQDLCLRQPQDMNKVNHDKNLIMDWGVLHDINEKLLTIDN